MKKDIFNENVKNRKRYFGGQDTINKDNEILSCIFGVNSLSQEKRYDEYLVNYGVDN